MCLNIRVTLAAHPKRMLPIFLLSLHRYDMKLDHKLRAISLTLQTACDFVIAFTATANSPTSPDPDSLALLASLWAQKMGNRHLSFESELAAHVRFQAFIFTD